jgi:glycosyltransferase involved in cell wall biosynthesis
MKKPQISIISPVYRVEKILPELIRRISYVMDKSSMTYEIVLVDDRSPDNSWEVISELSKEYKVIRAIRLSKNFGQHPAIFAGLKTANGENIIVMDCDLQDNPDEIPNLIFEIQKGFDFVLARRNNRQDSWIKKMFSRLFSVVFSFFTKTKFDNRIANFGVYSSKVIDAILEIPDTFKFFPLFVRLVGFKGSYIDVVHSNRYEGKSTYNFKALLKLAFNSIISYSSRPLKLTVVLGMLISITSFVVGIYYYVQYQLDVIKVSGFTSIIVSIWFLSGLIITILGIVGLYVGKIFEQSKNRPVFIIDQRIK